jgi:hypothetical protein
MKNNTIYIAPTITGRKVTVENTHTGDSATLTSDGRVEPEICDQVAVGERRLADFQESLDTVSIKGLLHRLKRANSESLDDQDRVNEICRETLGPGWKTLKWSKGDSGQLRGWFRSQGQTISLRGHSKPSSLSLVTWTEDTEGRGWMQTLSGTLDSNYDLQPDTVTEEALIRL